MAVKLVFLFMLWTLSSWFQDVTSVCNVTCTTDYKTSLNCSCLNSVPTYPMQLEANCSDHEEYVLGSCEIKPPLSWCLVKPQEFEKMTSIDTKCTATVYYLDSGLEMNVSETSIWELSYIVKPPMPFNVSVTESIKGFNITWDENNYLNECLRYRVRIKREKDPGFCKSLVQTYLLMPHDILQPYSNYIVDVQALLCPEAIYMGPGSEWSLAVEFSTKDKGWNLSTILPIFIVVFILLFCSSAFLTRLKPFWMKKFQLITFVPRPDEFFKPLYHTYKGNFKDWVRPVFSEFDILMNEKHQEVLPIWNTEADPCCEQIERKPGGCSLDDLYPSPISIHTVTLSGEDEPTDAFVSSVNTLGSYQDAQSFNLVVHSECVSYDLGEPQQSSVRREAGFASTAFLASGSGCPLNVRIREGESVSLDSFTSNEQSEEGYPRVGLDTIDSGFEESDCSSPVNSESNPAQKVVSGFFNVGGSSSRGCPLDVYVHEAERVSLNSFAFNEQSEDGYPLVDLDTIDSGFGESDCSSPVNSESNPAEQMDSAFFNVAGSSNYVKQWVICKNLPEDPSPHAPQ